MDKKLERRLHKLIALAERGVDGEKETAERMLNSLLEKHGLTIDDLGGELREFHWFKYGRGPFSKDLMSQVVRSVAHDGSAYTNQMRPRTIGGELTQAEAVEVELKFAAYKRALGDELDLFFQAFIHKHKLYSREISSSDGDDDGDVEASPEQRARIKRMVVWMQTMKHVDVKQALPGA